MRVEKIGDATLYLADCRDVISDFPQCLTLGAIVTDPPYGIGFKYESHDDSNYGEEGYGSWLWSILEEAEARLSPGAPIFVWQAQEHTKSFGEWFPRDWRILISAKNFVQMRAVAMQHAYEPVLVWWTPGEKPWRSSAGSEYPNRDWFVSDSASAVSDKTRLAKQHPCPRQDDVLEFIVSNWVKPKTTVFDPFMGSGTTGVAAVKHGRMFLGCEKEPKYFDIACRRIEEAYRQPRLFEEPPAKPVQPSFLDGDAA